MISAKRAIAAAAAMGAAATVLLTTSAASAATHEYVPSPVSCQANGETYPNGEVINVGEPGTVPVVCEDGQWVEQIPGEPTDGEQPTGQPG